MPFPLTVPGPGGTSTTATLGPAEILFILGANGTGKSALMYHINSSFALDQVRLVTAHRQNWLASSSPNMSPHQKRQNEHSIRHADRNAYSRWKDDYSHMRAEMTLFELIDAQNVRARVIANAADQGDIDSVTSLSPVLSATFSVSGSEVEEALRSVRDFGLGQART